MFKTPSEGEQHGMPLRGERLAAWRKTRTLIATVLPLTTRAPTIPLARERGVKSLAAHILVRGLARRLRYHRTFETRAHWAQVACCTRHVRA